MTAGGAVIGAPIERIDDERLLLGRGNYVDDLDREGLLHAAIVRSPFAHGVLDSIDSTDALAMPGVVAVYTHEDVMRVLGRIPKIPMRLAPLPELAPFEQDVVASTRVRYVGEPVAIVIARTPAEAEDAADRVFADIEPLPAVARCGVIGEEPPALLFEGTSTNASILYTAKKGDAKQATGPYIRCGKLSVQRHTAITMETRGLLAEWNAEASHMTVHGGAKVPFFTRRILAGTLGLPITSVDMIEVDVGGGFGVRGEFYPEDFLVPFAARELGKPVKWIEDRREHLLGTNHAREMQAEVEIVCEADGRVLALRGSVSVDVGAYMRSTVSAPSRNVGQFISGPYDVPNVYMESTCYLTNKTPIGTYRGPGIIEADYLRERMFDMAARDLGIDPVEFRRRNLVPPDRMPYSLADVDGPKRTEELDGGDYASMLDRCLHEFGWNDKAALQGRMIDGAFHGIAVSCFAETTATGPKELARIEMSEDGRLTVFSGASNIGQGVNTVLAQIASATLDIAIEHFDVKVGSTNLLAEGFGSFHSRATVMGGSAVLIAAQTLRKNIAAAAAAKIGCDESELVFSPGLDVSARGVTLTRADFGRMKLEAAGEFLSEKRTYGYGSAAAHVSVDPKTGKVVLHDYLVVQDIGRIINRMTAHGQIIGSIVQGLGGAFLENLVYDDDGQLLVGTLADYLLPSAADFPNIRAILLENTPSQSNPLGAKGVGEGGIMSVLAVVTNAVAAALVSLKVEPNHLPLSPSRLWEMIQASPVASDSKCEWA